MAGAAFTEWRDHGAEVLVGNGSTEDWAEDVWNAWAAHHETVRGWINQ